MKKLSFLELEKEMETLSEEEAFKTKAGGPPMDCAFQSFHYIMSMRYGVYNNLTEQGLEDTYNDYRNGKDDTPNLYEDYADVTGLQGINKPGKGLGWINSVLSDHYDDNLSSFSASYVEGNSAIPVTTNPGEVNQYMTIVDTGNSIHAVVFDHIDAEGKYICYDPQLNGAKVAYPPNAVEGTVIFHTQPSTTLPTTTFPTTTFPTTTGFPPMTTT